MKWNLTVLNDMIDDSIDSGIPLLRLSSDLIPFAREISSRPLGENNLFH